MRGTGCSGQPDTHTGRCRGEQEGRSCEELRISVTRLPSCDASQAEKWAGIVGTTRNSAANTRQKMYCSEEYTQRSLRILVPYKVESKSLTKDEYSLVL
jgi:hypothetical protein